jgi:GNAT superfamily N-acetyltransferase
MISNDAIRIFNLEPAYFDALEQLQRDCYPTLDDSELMKRPHFAAQYERFPAGQFVALDSEQGDRVIGQGSGFFIDFDFAHPNHSFREICGNFYFSNHNPDGAYYYGADISVHPDYRGRGVGKLLYAARKAFVKATNRRGIIGGGMIPGYAAHSNALSVPAYVEKVVDGELRDPTLTFQLAQGFSVRGIIEGYLEDLVSGGTVPLILWPNPAYQPAALR